jgi:hypothetical protein
MLAFLPFRLPITPHAQTSGTTPTTGTAAGPGLTFATNKAGEAAFKVSDEAAEAKTSGTPPDFLVDVQMGLAVAGGGLEGLPEDSCFATDFDELKDAVEVRLVLGVCQILSHPSTTFPRSLLSILLDS